MPETKTEQFDWINNLRIIALFAVIVLHTTSPVLETYNKGPLDTWLVGDLYNSLVRFAVPVFVMITGALMLHREYELGDFLKRRLSRIVAPFLFWSGVYIAYMYYNEDIDYPGDWWLCFKQVMHFLRDGASYHLWYVYMLIGLYLIMPVISKFVRSASPKEIRYFLVVWLLVMMIEQPYLNKYKPGLDLRYFEGFIGYLVLGHYLAFTEFKIPRLKAWMYALFFVSLTLIVAGTYLLYHHYNGISTIMYEPISPSIMLISASIFMIGKLSKPKIPQWVVKVRDLTGTYSFGIYLSHALILQLLDQQGLNYKLFAPMLSIPVTALTCLILSTLLVYVVNKIPFGKYVSG
ncbi:acyltransferase [Mucilaginibacter sp. AW1-3]